MNEINNKKTLSMGAVTLNVQDLERQRIFYQDTLGLDTIKKSENYISLGHGGKSVVNLREVENLKFPSINSAGLYHTAIVYPTREDLAFTLNKTLDKYGALYSGSSDHIVTEAFYFNDPEGNGVEIYFDKPRDEVPYENGKPKMGGSYLDESLYIQKYLNNKTTEEEIKMGHMHLKVGDIATAKKFYVDILNFDIMSEMPTALFISRDNYHHHIGMNTWESLGAGLRTPDVVYGLYSFEIRIEDKGEYNEIIKNLKENNVVYIETKTGIEVQDPWRNTIIINYEF